MFFEKIKQLDNKYLIGLGLILILLVSFLIFIFSSISMASHKDQRIFAYTVKVRDTVEQLDLIFERAEVNVNLMVDALSGSYNVNKQNDKNYNMHFLDATNGLIRSALLNSPNVDGAWFQVNASLPFAANAYNWYEYDEDQFIDVRSINRYGDSINSRDLSPTDDPYYFDAISTQKVTWSDIYTDVDAKKQMMTVSAPVYKINALVGVVGIDISVYNLQEVLKNMQSVLGESDLYLIDKKDNVIMSQLSSKVSSSKDTYPFLVIFGADEQGPIEYWDNSMKKTAIMFLLSNGYRVVISIPNRVLYKETNHLINIIYILFIMLICSVVVIFVNQYNKNKLTKENRVEEESDVKTKESDEDVEFGKE